MTIFKNLGLMNKNNELIDLLLDVLVTFLVTGFFIIDRYELWKFKVFDFGISSIVAAFFVMLFLLLVIFQYRANIGLFEGLLVVLIISLGFGAHSYGSKTWFLNLAVYQAFFSLGLGVLLLHRPARWWVFFIPMAVICGYVASYYLAHGNLDVAGIMPKTNRTLFGKIVVAFGMLGSLNYYIHKNWRPLPLIFYPLLTFMFAILSKSRGAIVIAMGFIVISMGAILYPYFKELVHSKTRTSTVKLLFFGVISLVLLVVLLKYVLFHTRFATSGLNSSGRDQIVADFFHAYTWKSIIVGVPVEQVGRFSNLHNSYLQVLGQSGIIGWITLGLCSWVLWLLVSSKHYIATSCFILLAVYSLVEYFVFLYIGDLVLFPLIVYAYHRRTRVNK